MNLQVTELLGIEVLDQSNNYLGCIEYMDNLNIANSSDKQELTSGPKMAVLHSVSSNYKSEVSGTAVASVDLFTLLFGETPTSSDTTLMVASEKGLTPTSNKVSIKETPVENKPFFVFDTTAAGTRKALEVGDPTTDAPKYEITGKQITVTTSVKSVKV